MLGLIESMPACEDISDGFNEDFDEALIVDPLSPASDDNTNPLLSEGSDHHAVPQ